MSAISVTESWSPSLAPLRAMGSRERLLDRGRVESQSPSEPWKNVTTSLSTTSFCPEGRPPPLPAHLHPHSSPHPPHLLAQARTNQSRAIGWREWRGLHHSRQGSELDQRHPKERRRSACEQVTASFPSPSPPPYRTLPQMGCRSRWRQV
jgi:hypothetical protein